MKCVVYLWIVGVVQYLKAICSTVLNVQNANISITKVGIIKKKCLDPVIFTDNRYHMDYTSEKFLSNFNG